MDTFVAFEFSEIQPTDIAPNPGGVQRDDEMKQLVNADAEVPYGGYCVIA